MLFELQKTNLQAVGEYVILVSQPVMKGDKNVTSWGFELPEEQESKLPELCVVYSIGSDVPEGFVNVGDVTPLPTGAIKNVPQLDVVLGKVKEGDVRQKYVTCHYKAIPCVYKKES